MNEGLTIRMLDLGYPLEKDSLVRFLAKNGLHFESDITVAYGIFDSDETLLGCGCAAGRLLKCFAVDETLRGQNALGLLVSKLMENRYASGFYDLFVVTRAHNEALFSNCGFHPVAEATGLVLLENRSNGPERFAARLTQPALNGKTIGAIVMNCNPFTKGHRALAEYAAAHCDLLYLFVVETDRSLFPTEVRYHLVKEGVADLKNVQVCLSGPYMISSATFPTYFLKKDEDATALQAELDITLFAQRIAPALHITKRFAGQEPLDPTTARYNNAMSRILPQYGIEFCEIPRVCQNGEPISASRLRALLQTEGLSPHVLELVPDVTAAYLKENFQF